MKKVLDTLSKASLFISSDHVPDAGSIRYIRPGPNPPDANTSPVDPTLTMSSGTTNPQSQVIPCAATQSRSVWQLRWGTPWSSV